MSEADKTATLAAAWAVLADVNAGRLRREWAKHVLAWLERGDMAAAKRCGYVPPASTAVQPTEIAA